VASREVEPVPAAVERLYNSTTDLLTQPAPQPPLERYGRAGGYVGRDQFEALDWSTRDQISTAVGGGHGG
jgi:hypothetical protein